MPLPLNIAPEIATALKAQHPVVALESTIISHGMPYPQNIETARKVEAVIRDTGATPATIAVIDGYATVGLDDTALERLAKLEGDDVQKLTRANLSRCIASSGTGSTTVAATMIIAHLAGIQVFATGGIGGVHRGAEQSFDISADLHEFARTPVAVVCSGAKAILDIPKTLEVLETLGVPVTTYGQSEFPAFWSRSSGLASPSHVLEKNGAAEIAAQILTQGSLGLGSGHVIANPIPKHHEIPSETMFPIIEEALAVASAEGVSHGDVTPFLLDRIYHQTEGRSLEANIGLVMNNAELASKIAVELGKQRIEGA